MDRLTLYQQLGTAARVGETLVTVNPALAPVGCIGAVSTVAELRACEAWLRDQGCTQAWGPMEQATWFPYRANLGPHDAPSFFGEPTADPQPWRDAGYQESARYGSSLCPNDAAIAYGETKGITGVTLRPMGDFETTLGDIHRITHAAFAPAHGFTPLPLPALQALYQPLLGVVDPRMVLFAEADGATVGFVFGVADHLAPGSGRFLVKSLAVLPSAQRSGLGAWMVGELHRVADRLGFTHGVHALMWAGSNSRAISAHGGVVFREYGLFRRDL
jgi:GNAT superfamily N-acetyltransferase